MKKVLAVAAVLAVLGVLARRRSPKMRNVDWETARGDARQRPAEAVVPHHHRHRREH